MQDHDPFVGTWKLIPAESQFDQNHQPSERTLHFVREDDGYLMKAEGVSKGEAIREQPQKFYLDGCEHSVPQAPGVCTTSTRMDGNTIWVTVRRSGVSLGEGVYCVSSDGRTLTTTLSGVDAEQRTFQSTVVWRRV